MKVFFDTEFTGLYKNATLISIGFVSEDDRSFYAELTDYDKSQCNDWVQENVIKNLNMNKEESERENIPNYHVGTKEDIKNALNEWFKQFDEVQLVSDVCHYDMVLFVDLFGTAFDLPENVSPTCYDINQDIAKSYQISQREAFDKSREEILSKNNKDGSRTIKGDKHNSLYDAKVIKEVSKIMEERAIQQEKYKSVMEEYNKIVKEIEKDAPQKMQDLDMER